jgi:hypothetical protein
LEREGLENPMSRRSPRPGVKRVYEPPEDSEGTRVLVDRTGLAGSRRSMQRRSVAEGHRSERRPQDRVHEP